MTDTIRKQDRERFWIHAQAYEHVWGIDWRRSPSIMKKYEDGKITLYDDHEMLKNILNKLSHLEQTVANMYAALDIANQLDLKLDYIHEQVKEYERLLINKELAEKAMRRAKREARKQKKEIKHALE